MLINRLNSIIMAMALCGILSCSNDKSNNPATVAPTVTTASITGISQTTAVCGGTVTSDGGKAVFYRGVCWRSDSMPSYANAKTYDGTGTGFFVSALTGLTASTKYYIRAYAMNDVGLGYGSVDSFTTFADSTGQTAIDIDGNVYQTINIGSQVWMAENLKVTHYRTGEDISNIVNQDVWDTLTTGAYCQFDNDTSYIAVYGRLYNWYAVDDSRNLAPAGWHIPTDAEWKQLEINLGMSQADADLIGYRSVDVGGKLKETGILHWSSPNTGATNESGFTALPGGGRSDNGSFFQLGISANFWTSTANSLSDAWDRSISSNNAAIYRIWISKRYGISVRCVKDPPPASF
jgi:uncharacterized protein (TIGR02145 family)